jgi:YD repeat-containing protein
MKPRWWRSALSALCLFALALTLTACTKLATHEGGALQYDAVEAQQGSFSASQDVPAYNGSWVAKAHLDQDPSAGAHARGAFSVDPSVGAQGTYGAAFYFPPGTFNGPTPKQKGDLDILGWEYGGGAEIGAVRISALDHKARLVRQQASQTDAIGSAFALQEGCWNWLVVAQTLSDQAAGTNGQATSELYLNGQKLFTSHAPNAFGHAAQNVRYGVVSVDPAAQDEALDVYLDDSYASTYEVKPPAQNACDSQTGVDPTAIDRSAQTPLADATAFLYSGEFPIQHGVASGTIEPERASVVRGQVKLRGGEPLAGVRVSAVGHPELGFTDTQPDGQFYLAANGGSQLRLRFEKDGYLPTERKLAVPWQDYEFTDDVVLIGVDPQYTDVDLDDPPAAIQVARGSPVTDADGTRQATLLFPQGTSAEMTLPDGSTQPLTDPRVRASEYTAGASGPEAMPAELPATSAYTYALEFSADQALAAGARKVSFSQPLPTYTDNFLSFPTGETVPAGYYDPAKGAWVPSESGRVVKLLSEAGGIAELDVDGSGNPATASQLEQLGISDDERRTLSQLYDAGKTLWRVRVSHFTPWDLNWALRPPDGATFPGGQPRWEEAGVDSDCEGPGSVLECEDQALGEELDLTGTPHSLNYRSDRVPGRTAQREIEIPLTDQSPPSALKRIELETEIAGRRFEQSFQPAPGLSHSFSWDGKDVFGRTLQGGHTATVTISYVYDGAYQRTTRFASPGTGERITGSQTRQELTFTRTHEVRIGGWDARGQGLGGFTLDSHHAYDPLSNTLYLGTGEKRSASEVSRTISTLAGNGTIDHNSPNYEGSPAIEARIRRAFEVERVRKVSPDGTINTVAGPGTCPNPVPTGPDPDAGQQATQASFCDIADVEVAPDGTLYLLDRTLARVRRVLVNGTIEAIAGDGNSAYSAQDEGAPATEASLDDPSRIAVAPDGSVFVADARHGRIRQITPDGRITTAAGDGSLCFEPDIQGRPLGDGEPARSHHACFITDMEAGPDGALYFAQSITGRVRTIGRDGILRTLAGCSPCQPAGGGDGGPATQARLEDPTAIDFSAEGALYIADGCANKVRRVSPEGVITTYAGTGVGDFNGEGQPARAAYLNCPQDLGAAADGSLLVADTFSGSSIGRFRAVKPLLPGFRDGDIAIASEDGSELYRFDERGRHLETRSTLTGAVLYSFDYDSAGRLASVTDGDANETEIERDPESGEPSAIVAPFGQRTELALDTNGYLSELTNPESETTAFDYSADGLLESLTDPKDGLKDYDYGAHGRLVKATDQGTSFKELSRTDTSSSYETTLRTKLDRTSKYKVERLPAGDLRRVHTDSAGLESTLRSNQDATRSATAADGTITSNEAGPDPRFEMNAPILKGLTVTTPGNAANPSRTLSVQGARQATLQNQADPLTLETQTDTLQLNGRTYTTAFDAGADRFTTTSPESRTTTTELDDQGRPTHQAVSGIDPLLSSYRPDGLLETQTQGNRGWSYTYEPSGFLDTITDPLDRVTSFDYDGAGRVTRQVLPGAREVLYAYDDNGNLTQVTPPSKPAHGFAHTPVDLLSSYTAPEITLDPALPRTTSYAYDDDNALDQITRPGGAVIDFSYNSANGRLEKITQPRGDTDLSYSAQTGNLASISAPGNEHIDFEFDGSLPTRETFSGTVSGSASRSYDDDLRLASSSVNGGHTVTYSYDDDSLLTGAEALALERDAQNGLLTSTTLDQTSTTLAYSGFGEPQSQDAKFGSTTLYGATFTRDDLGRITQKVETTSQGTHTYDYRYDPAGRLDQVDRDGTPVSDYDYDENGNRTLEAISGKDGAYDEQDRLASYGATAYTYTAAGELHTKRLGADETTYDYDALGSLEHVTLPDGTPIDYVTDGYGRRIAKKRNGNLVQGFLYGEEALGPLAELDSQGNVDARFVYATRSNVPDYMTKGGNTYRIVTDHLGSPRMIVDASNGAVAQELEYDEFGNVVRDTAPLSAVRFRGGRLRPRHEHGAAWCPRLRFRSRTVGHERSDWFSGW